VLHTITGGENMRARSAREVCALLESGIIDVAEALRIMRELEAGVFSESDAIPQSADSLVSCLQELETLIGLHDIKAFVKELQALVHIQRRRAEESLPTEPLVMHMIFKGNPGTGKTTVARIFGKMLRSLGVLPKGHLIEVERADLVGEYIGHTAQKTREQIKRALGGILFIDEAYSLARGGEKDFGKEAIDTIVKAMEDHKESLIVILAGYRREMENFIRTNPGLNSRFPIHMDFCDYSLSELLQIAARFLERRQYRLSKGAEMKLRCMLSEKLSGDRENFGNARLVRNLIERGIRKQAWRLYQTKDNGREDLMLITQDDIT